MSDYENWDGGDAYDNMLAGVPAREELPVSDDVKPYTREELMYTESDGRILANDRDEWYGMNGRKVAEDDPAGMVRIITEQHYQRLLATARLAVTGHTPDQRVTKDAATLFDKWCGVDRGGNPVLDFEGFQNALAESRPSSGESTHE